jgi:hypothetical protein
MKTWWIGIGETFSRKQTKANILGKRPFLSHPLQEQEGDGFNFWPIVLDPFLFLDNDYDSNHVVYFQIQMAKLFRRGSSSTPQVVCS